MPEPDDATARRKLDCEAASGLLPAMAAGDLGVGAGFEVGSGIERHVQTCLRCQADLARYRRLRRTMRSFGERTVKPGPDVLPSILASLALAGSGRAPAVAGRRTVYVGGVWVATAGAAAGVLVWVTRRRLTLAG